VGIKLEDTTVKIMLGVYIKFEKVIVIVLKKLFKLKNTRVHTRIN